MDVLQAHPMAYNFPPFIPIKTFSVTKIIFHAALTRADVQKTHVQSLCGTNCAVLWISTMLPTPEIPNWAL